MKITKMVSIIIPSFFILLSPLTSLAMSSEVAKEYCSQIADEESVTKEERYEFIKDCVNSVSDEELQDAETIDETDHQEKTEEE